jgi:hypothetical protein
MKRKRSYAAVDIEQLDVAALENRGAVKTPPPIARSLAIRARLYIPRHLG